MIFSVRRASFFLLLLSIDVLSMQFIFCYAHRYNISAVFVFGDSTVDPGNNNYFPTIARGNFPPYGRDFKNHEATGRFSNGKLVTDFIASYLQIKDAVPPYLDPTLTIEDLITGVSFASAGAGHDELTCTIGGALTPSQQLELFKDYKAKLEVAIGKEKTDDLIGRAVYVMSSGTNDFTFNYYGPAPARRNAYPTLSSYHKFLWQNIEKFLQVLVDEGAKYITISGVVPMGCLPAMITINSKNPVSDRECIERLNSIARDYNKIFEDEIKNFQRSGSKVLYADVYKPVIEMVQNKGQYGFEEVHTGCCGTGLIEADFMCNPNSPVCPDVEKHLFWDAFHPTERGYYVLSKALQPLVQQFMA